MVVAFARIVRRMLLGSLAVTAVVLPTLSQPVEPLAASAADAYVRLMPEVRLRKLHLVRPDLIPYPIAYEVYC